MAGRDFSEEGTSGHDIRRPAYIRGGLGYPDEFPFRLHMRSPFCGRFLCISRLFGLLIRPSRVDGLRLPVGRQEHPPL